MRRDKTDPPPRQPQSLKAQAEQEGKTISAYAMEKLLPTESDSEKTFKELNALLRQRIEEAHQGVINIRSFGEVAAEILDGAKSR